MLVCVFVLIVASISFTYTYVYLCPCRGAANQTSVSLVSSGTSQARSSPGGVRSYLFGSSPNQNVCGVCVCICVYVNIHTCIDIYV